MAKICWIPPAVGVLFSLLALTTAQPPGFLSIKCGGKTNYTDENSITWVTDADYIDVGETAVIGNVTEDALGSSLDSLRFFPKPLNKSCYQLPVLRNVPYLLRLWFIIGNYSGHQTFTRFAYSFETVDMLATENFDNQNYVERIFVTSGTVMYVCLLRTSGNDDPFITGIELRPLRHGMYAQAKPGTMLFSQFRTDAGGKYLMVRYPDDHFDRIWKPDLYIDIKDPDFLQPINSERLISTNNTKELPPLLVMQTAWLVNSSDGVQLSLGSSEGTKALLVLYFAELQMLNMSESRSINFSINGEAISEIITLVPNYSALELTFVSNESDYFILQNATESTPFPIINAYEYYVIINTDPATYSQDIEAVDSVKRSFDIKDWVSDPCYVIPWKGIRCDNSTSVIRISEIDLSRRNITASVPNDIVQLTGLVNVALDNNHLIGSLPNFSKLIMLERLYLQNNNLSGTVPEWLSQLKNLKELNIENNNFSGVIPGQLLLNCSLNFKYFGNPHLRMDRRKCTLQNSNNNRLKVVLGITLSGILIIVLALIVSFVVVYRKRIRRKEEAVTMRSSGVEMEPRRLLYQDYSIIAVPNPTKSHAFTLEEMVAATQTFSREIGRGGFGSVFFGKLPDGKDIAVKVLSLFSHQGVHEFLNEVDLLSKINHRNLVPLLGYCNETREVMLVYEYMSGGSLRDHLYGPLAEKSSLNWKTRLKIALDAAQGLEYLHVGSTPKIIHRDIKTANILLDSRRNGKLADFGLSRVTIDGEATHVTTAVKGTAGYLDPEYYSTQMLTEKSDVYSFGVVLLEIICGRPPIDLKLPLHELNIVRWVTPYAMEIDESGGKIREIIDKRLGGSYNMKSMGGVMKVAMRCVQVEPSCRPSVSEVVAELKEAINDEDISGFSISEETAIESDITSLAGPVCSALEISEPKAMEWSDNSSNIPKVGR